MSQNISQESKVPEQKHEVSEFDQNITEFLTQTHNLEKILASCYPEIFGAVIIKGKNKDVYDESPEIFKVWVSHQVSNSLNITTLKVNVKYSIGEFRCSTYGNCECGIYHGNKEGSDHPEVNCRCCSWIRNNIYRIERKVLTVNYIPAITEFFQIDDEMFTKITSILLESGITDQKLILVYNSELLHNQKIYLYEHQIISVKLGEKFEKWMGEKYSKFCLEF